MSENIRWLKQRTVASCAPIAWMNLLKWKGENITYEKHFKKWAKRCETSSKGSWKWYEGFDRVGLEYARKVHPTLKHIQDQVMNGCPVVFCSAIGDTTSDFMLHMFLITKATKRSLYCVNLEKDHKWIPNRRFVREYMQRCVYNHHKDIRSDACQTAPVAWVFWKKDAKS